MRNPPPGAGSEWASSFAPGSFGSLEGRGALPRGTARGSSAQGPPRSCCPRPRPPRTVLSTSDAFARQ